jgi:hypothetical protein
MPSALDPAGYTYHHGTGEHLLVYPDRDVNRPKYSLHCCLCQCLDCVILLFVFGFLGFAFWLCYYLYNNYDGD